MERERHLDWDGCLNARDLGGLPTVSGRATRWRAVVRADNVDRLTALANSDASSGEAHPRRRFTALASPLIALRSVAP